MKPIIFSGESVRAIREGRKTQTRRVVRDVPGWVSTFGFSAFTPKGKCSGRGSHPTEGPAEKFFRCPYGQPSDRLWVREGHAWADELVDGFEREDPVVVAYRADGEIRRHEMGQQVVLERAVDPAPHNLASSYIRWRPSIHTPRWASRLTLQVASIRVERLQDISEEDAMAEGVEPFGESLDRGQQITDGDPRRTQGPHPYTLAFACAWDTLNVKRDFGWAENPWVWVVEFRVAK